MTHVDSGWRCLCHGVTPYAVCALCSKHVAVARLDEPCGNDQLLVEYLTTVANEARAAGRVC